MFGYVGYKKRILRKLKRKYICPTYVLTKITHRFSVYIQQLRKEGHIIKTVKEYHHPKWYCYYVYKGKINE